MHIVEDKLEVIKNILNRYEDKGNLYIIEDRLDVLLMAKNCNPKIFTIWMKRGRYVEKQRFPVKYTPDAAIHNLHEAIPLIRDN